MNNPDYCTYDKSCLWKFCEDETGNFSNCPYDSKTTTELYLKEETNMAKETKKVTVSQVELGKEVNEREQKLKDQIKLLKEQNTCHAKRCKALEEQRDTLEEKVSDLDKIITDKDVDICGLERKVKRVMEDKSRLYDRIRKLEFSRDCIINGAYSERDRYYEIATRPIFEDLNRSNEKIRILKDYYISNMSIEDIMKKYLICESSIKYILFNDHLDAEL